MRRRACILGALCNGGILAMPLFLLPWPWDRSGRIPTLVFVVLHCLWACLESRQASKHEEETGTGDRAWTAWVVPAQGLAFLLTTLVALGERSWLGGPLPLPLAMLALGGMALGMVLRLWAMKTLKGMFLTDCILRPDHVLVLDGPYRYLRHPSELGNAVILAATVWLFGSMLGLGALCLVYLPLALIRIRREKAMLDARFGAGVEATGSRYD